ncbi:hypothetical protein SSX86_021083 [Deinandra increscens subsp. villosa]|uniref:Acyltransferase n=1 Tax=Deinandra increscens subsp. villosa TaxID=3103831 RepID=A0AAP0CP78_9ASTR
MDLLNPKLYIPMLLFYPNNRDEVGGLTAEQKAIALKKSLSESLTRYYPFAGRFTTPTSPYVDCNDEGVLFLEARNDNQLDTFRRMSWHDETLDQLFVDDLVFYKNTSSKNVVAVQLNHFACGGVGLAVSLAHAIGDGSTLGSFLSHWASVARYGSIDHKEVVPLNPHFIRSPRSDSTQSEPGTKKVIKKLDNNFASRKFVFPNSKLNELKYKVAGTGAGSINDPTRVEVLTSLLYTTAVAAATTKTGCFKPSYLHFMVNVREKFVHKLPQSTVGNFVKVVMVKTMNASESSLSWVVEEMRKKKLEVGGIESVQKLAEWTKDGNLENGDLENVVKGSYKCSSLCGFPFHKLDFGWGKPTGTTLAIKAADKSGFVMMDCADGDGIEVMLNLEKECMDIFENDKELLSYCRM